MYRELDKGTIYILEKLKKIKDRKTFLLNIIFYRFFNRFNLYEKLGFSILEDFSIETKEKLKRSLEKLKREEPLFNDAYLIAGKKGEEKYVSVLDVLSELDRKSEDMISRIDKCETPEESFEILKELTLVGDFLAYEIWTDLTYFNFFQQGWTDNDFVNIGPGAKSGLEILYGKKNKKEQKKLLCKLHKTQETFLSKKTNPSWKDIAYKPSLSLRNIEHSLCEFRKYYNLTMNKGKKRKFYPH